MVGSDAPVKGSAAGGDRPAIGVDLGGTKIEAIALTATGAELCRHRVATPTSYDAMLAAVAGLVATLESEVGRAATVGIGAPGSLSPATGVWRNSNREYCNGRDLPADFAAALERPVRVENDANCFVLSEAVDGAGADAWCVYGLTVGTGLGGGMTLGRVLNRGQNAAAGEIGHIPLPWLKPEDYPLPSCYCGLEGCAEQYVSGTGLARDFEAATGLALPGEEIIARAGAGEPQASAAVARLHDRFARVLSVLVNILDPDVIVLGGGLSKAPGFRENVAGRVSRYTFARDISVRVVNAAHGASSGVRGAARLWGLPGA